MEIKDKILTLVASALILGLAFVAGQVFFYSRQGKILLPALPAAGSFDSGPPGFIKENLTLAAAEKTFSIKPQELETWVENYRRSWTGKWEYRLNQEKIRSYLKNLSKEIDIAPISARFSINKGEIGEFAPSQKGRVLNVPESLQLIVAALTSSSLAIKNIELVIDGVEPELTLDKVNNLGINALLGLGESDFTDSPNQRVRNINTGSNKLNGALLRPGQEFSFNQSIGSVDALNGYLPELVIKRGTLVPEYGGGLCQVSTTLFRAAAVAGLAILERHPHSIPVRYYNPQGFDAAVYPGFSDLRFKNDTAAHILIQSKISGSKLYFEIYGTDDGRRVTIDGPHQYDVRANGAMKAILTRTIIYADGTEKKDVFNSSYRSNSAFVTVRNPLE
jgi:vancomycin resistance protein YoaR